MKKIGVIVLCCVLLSSCRERSRFYIDTDKVPVNIKIERFDKDIYHIKTDNIQKSTDSLRHVYGSFLDIYTKGVLEIGVLGTPENNSAMRQFLTDTSVHHIYNDCLTKYKNTEKVNKSLNTAFRYFKYYFPNKPIPRVLFHVSGFNQSIVITDSVVSASIDNYLGENYPPYKQVAYNYEIPTMTEKRLPVDIVLGWISSEFYMDTQSGRLLENIIYNGKMMYLLSIFFPDYTEAEIMGYSEKQLKWCQKNETNIWAYILENKQLFSNDWKNISRYINPAPFTAGMSEESPGRIGIWIGFQIVKNYAEKQKDLTLPQIMEENNCQKILQLSGYRP